MIWIEVRLPHRCGRRRKIPGQSAWRDYSSAVGIRDKIIRIVRDTRIRCESAFIRDDILRLHGRGLHRGAEMSVVHPARRTAAGRLPLPYVDIAGVSHREMEAPAGHGSWRFGDRMGACMESVVASKACIRSGQQHRKLVLIVVVLVSGLVAVVKQVPSVDFLNKWQMFQRPRGIFPCEQEIRPSAVVHRANLNSRFSFAVKIPSRAGHQGEWPDVSPGSIGCIAVEDGYIGTADAVNL